MGTAVQKPECGVETNVVNQNGQPVVSTSLKKIQTLFLKLQKKTKWVPTKVGTGFTFKRHKFECHKNGNRSQWMVSTAVQKPECGVETNVVNQNGQPVDSTSLKKIQTLFEEWMPSKVGNSFTKNG